MSIAIDTDLYILAGKLNLSTDKLKKYKNKSIDEIVDAEAAQGNTQAAALYAQILSNPAELVKVFKLADVGNKFAILNNLNEHDLKNLLPLLDAKDLSVGLNFFTKDKLLKLSGQLPKQELVKYVTQMFSPEQIMKLMPEESMNKVLESKDLEKGLVLKYLKTIKPEILAQMIEAATGKAATGQNQYDLINEISTLPPDKYKDALVSMPTENKRVFMLKMIKDDPKVLELFDSDSYVKLLSQKEKPELVKAAESISPEELVKMIGQLPQDLIAVVCTQIDPEVFASVLSADFKEILKQIVAA